MRTVIIDDDIFFTELLSKKLYQFGLTTIKKIESFQQLKEQEMSPDVFFIDFHLRGGNCNKIINYIESKYKEASIIIMSDNDYAYELLKTKNKYFFFPKSKIKYLKFQIYAIKERILSRQKGILMAKGLYVGATFLLLYLSMYLAIYL